MRFFNIDKDNWPNGVSNGLTLPCAICSIGSIKFDYNVTDELWNLVVPKELKRDVICLPCLDKLVREKGADLASNVNFIQFTGTGVTIEFVPVNVFYYKGV